MYLLLQAWHGLAGGHEWTSRGSYGSLCKVYWVDGNWIVVMCAGARGLVSRSCPLSFKYTVYTDREVWMRRFATIMTISWAYLPLIKVEHYIQLFPTRGYPCIPDHSCLLQWQPNISKVFQNTTYTRYSSNHPMPLELWACYQSLARQTKHATLWLHVRVVSLRDVRECYIWECCWIGY